MASIITKYTEILNIYPYEKQGTTPLHKQEDKVLDKYISDYPRSCEDSVRLGAQCHRHWPHQLVSLSSGLPGAGMRVVVGSTQFSLPEIRGRPQRSNPDLALNP